MSSRRRAYPQPQYAAAPPVADPSQYQQSPYGAPAVPAVGGAAAGVPAPVAPTYGVDQLNQGFQNMNVGQPSTASPYQQPYNAYPQQVPQQPAAPQQPYDPYQQAQAGLAASGATPYAPQYSAGGAVGGIPSPGTSAYGQPPLNQLYTTDLLRELPPPISDLSLPPPPIILPPNAAVVPTSEDSNANPEYFRSTLNVIPNNHSLLKKTKLPLALVVRPYGDLHIDSENIPVASDTLIARCRRCRGYINPFITLTEQGRRWRCNFCNLQNDIPSGFEYDAMHNPKNKFERPELNHAVVEFIAPKEYMARAPQPVVFTFIIDVSADAVSSGLTSTITRTILESLDRIPNDKKTTKVAFIGVDSNLHFFRFNEGLDGIESLIVSDIDEPFLPSPEGLLVNLDENRPAIEKLLIDFPTFFEGTANVNFALGPALKAGHKMISSIGGKLICFAATLPNLGEGKLSIRDESQSGKQKESQVLLNAADKFYKSFAVDCNSVQVTVDLFLTATKYQDVATLSNLPRFTAGQTHYYPAWTCAKAEDVTKLSREVSEHLSMDIALEAVLRCRGSTGLRMSSFYGNFFNRSSDLCSFPSFPRDQSYTIEVSIEETLTKPVVYFQAAVLHSTCFGERRIRVMNMAIPTSSKIDDIYASADQLAIANFFTHRAVEKALSSSIPDARELLVKSVTDVLNVFKKELISGNVSGSSPLQISTNLRMLPLLLFSLTKHLGLRNEKVPSDHRAAALNNLASLPIPHLIKYIYPAVYSLHNMPDECGLPEQIVQVNEETGEEETISTTEILLPEPINNSKESWENYGLYLIDNSSELFLWVSGDVVPELVQDLFGANSLYEIPTGKTELPEFSIEESEFNYKVRQIIGKIREQRDSITWKNLYVVYGGSSNEPIDISQQRDLMALRLWALSCLVEDKSHTEIGYREFLSQLKSRVAV
ncbi:protein transport protein SEC24 [Hyphopichia burtonii NRRL Y-1933]|uniref:Protein transport protein SEC24 n=1 Tax=Hyphopichia burtonii NRRL Y-1933 TaxID=984485 RepID=A0A1E4RDD4_9ASCO|nr:protein transport protein SEC24 [Hyphopichia burtonii NRRL Y-1933]ODV65135.1 protein transport protein SEC24 [Hyphopichia burtonii NRRL Y-1933]